MLLREVVGFGAILVRVEELPAVFVEVALVRRQGAVFRRGLPPLLPDAPRAAHLVVLGLLRRRRLGLVEGVTHRHACERRLFYAVDNLGPLDAAALEDCGHDVGTVMILVAHLTTGLDALGPMDDQRIAGPA